MKRETYPKNQGDIPVRQRNSNNDDIEDKEIPWSASVMVVQLWIQGNTHSSKPKPTSKHHKNIVFAHFDNEPSLQTKPNQTKFVTQFNYLLFWGFGSCWMLSNLKRIKSIVQHNERLFLYFLLMWVEEKVYFVFQEKMKERDPDPGKV